jgi:hypothetical protein
MAFLLLWDLLVITNRYNRPLKNTHLLRCAYPSSLRRTVKYASFLRISHALHLDVFDQPGGKLLPQQPDNYITSYIPAVMVSQWHSDLAHGGMKKVCGEKGEGKKSQEVIPKAQRHRVFRNAEWGNS